MSPSESLHCSYVSPHISKLDLLELALESNSIFCHQQKRSKGRIGNRDANTTIGATSIKSTEFKQICLCPSFCDNLHCLESYLVFFTNHLFTNKALSNIASERCGTNTVKKISCKKVVRTTSG
jgi:hypothetical protein